jgi:predicted Kef-type K+ transport protein
MRLVGVLAATTHDVPLIATIAGSLAFAFVGGLVAVRLRFSPLIGYLPAGIVVGSFTPGFIADAHLAPQLAEIGVILLMFGRHLLCRLRWRRSVNFPLSFPALA